MQLQSRKPRQRGAILTAQGLRKLNQAKSELELEQNFRRYTLEALSQKTGLTPTTLSKVFIGSAKVERQTLQCCFKAFNLTLETDDYLYLKCHPGELAETSSIPPSECLCPIDSSCDSSLKTQCVAIHTTQTHKMPPPQDSIEPLPSTAPKGQMPLNSILYLNRPPLESHCYEVIQQPGAMLNIRAPKQMGKTSLITRILAHAKTLGYRTVSLNLQLADAEILQNLELFLQWFCARVSKQLGLPNAISGFWDRHLGSKSNATDYLEDVLLAHLVRAASPRENHPIVIAIDELSQIFAYPNIAREFLELLRVWSELAKASDTDSNPWYYLRLITVHSTEIQMPVSINQSLLNTGLAIELPEFTHAQVQELAQRWGLEMTAQQIEQLIVILGDIPIACSWHFTTSIGKQ